VVNEREMGMSGRLRAISTTMSWAGIVLSVPLLVAAAVAFLTALIPVFVAEVLISSALLVSGSKRNVLRHLLPTRLWIRLNVGSKDARAKTFQ
jgi:hypothetical protein